jgi:7-cyano-7-deazaguanine tRNA-ribosyltransferase
MRRLRTRNGREYSLPMFLPVYQSNSELVPREAAEQEGYTDGCIVNAYFLYKQRELRREFQSGLRLRDYVNCRGLLMTDSGAFQGFARRVLLSNSNIVKFQDQIGADIVSPLDLVTPPGDSRTIAEQKMEVTLKRVQEGRGLVEHSLLTGVQQGGRFMDLRRRSIEGLIALGSEHVALGSLVPFFTRNHDLTFVFQVIREARAMLGPDVPIHVYGAGDPVELPLMVAMGADIFDSSSYGHFAKLHCYMTPFGALRDPGRVIAGEYTCECHACVQAKSPAALFQDVARLAEHNLWTICDTVRRLRDLVASDTLLPWIGRLLEVHSEWFPESKLAAAWSAANEQ